MSKDMKELLARKLAENNLRHVQSQQETHVDLGRNHKKIAVSSIQPNPYQPRKSFIAEEIAELAASISEMGLLQPITVRQCDDYYELIAGERRLRAYKLLGRPMIEALIMTVEDSDMAILGLAENLQREDLSDYEIGKALRVIEKAFSSKKKLSEALGINREDMYRYFAYESLPLSLNQRLESKPHLLGRSAAADIKRVIQNKDTSMVEDILINAWNLLENGELTQNKIADFVIKQFEPSLAKTAYPKSIIMQGENKIGTWQTTSKDIVIKLNANSLTEQQQLLLKDFLTQLTTGQH